MIDVTEVAGNIYLIDDYMYSIPRTGSAYLINEDRKALVEVGPSPSVSLVLDAIKRVGVKPQDVEYIVLSHIHLDHGGGVGLILENMPRARVIVHQKGAAHLVNPAKLIEGMRASQGEDYLRKCGQVIPVPAHRLLPVADGDTIALSDRQVLRFMDAPGHAPHQLCVFETRNGGVFTGEAAGTLLCEGKSLFPFNTPPSFNLTRFIQTIERLKALQATRIYYSHFGVSTRVQENLELAAKKALLWDGIVNEAMEKNIDHIADRMAAAVHEEIEQARDVKLLYDFIKTNIVTCAAAYIKYYRDKQLAAK